jgi:outer membrane receptor for ferrienterochelin and colicins
VHKVRVLDAAYFQRMAANNLGEALRNELNVQLRQDNVLGTSMRMQGLGGENVKILIDGVPVIGRLDGHIDLSQLDLSGIERAEIIEGPLSVSYGTNALAGTINLITRKGGSTPSAVQASAYAEHIGRLNTVVAASHRWGANSMMVNAGRNYFNGWDPDQDDLPGLSAAPADTNRYQQWKPREQYFGRLGYRRVGTAWTLGYKGELMHDRIIDRGMPRAPYYETAFDAEYVTLRLDNALFAEHRRANGHRVNMQTAYDLYARRRNTWFRDLTTLSEELVPVGELQDTTRFSLFNARAIYGAPSSEGRPGYEAGLDLNVETGEGGRLGPGRQDIGDHAVFASAEVAFGAHVVVRPGVRYAYNTRYDAPVIPSLNLRWRMAEGWTLRGAYARGFRAPSLKELYFQFVDVNHDIMGNPELEAERSHHLGAGVDHRRSVDQGVLRGELGLFYNEVEDLISLAQVSTAGYTYVNIGQMSTWGGTLGAAWEGLRWNASVGAGLTARADELSRATDEAWMMTPELRASATRTWRKGGWSASLFWKYQGEQVNYVAVSDTEIVRGDIASFHMADASLARTVWRERLRLTAGCKDLFDVQNVQASLAGGGVHANGGTSVPMTTGRTWFLRVELDLKKKDP